MTTEKRGICPTCGGDSGPIDEYRRSGVVGPTGDPSILPQDTPGIGFLLSLDTPKDRRQPHALLSMCVANIAARMAVLEGVEP
jgi:hypothetical protein